jgi:hypothetical protein
MSKSNIGRRLFLRNTGITAFSWSLSSGLKPGSPLERLVAASNTGDGKGNLYTDRPAAAGGQPLRAVKVGKASPLLDNGGDTWVAAWADDDNLYSPSNDTGGFHKAANANIAFNRLTGGDPGKLSGLTVSPMLDYGKGGQEGPDGCTWKSSGCTSLDGTLYWVVARHLYGEKSGDLYRRQTAQNASIIKSRDFGRTWTRPVGENYQHPMFPGRRFATPYFVEYGRHRVDVDDAGRYVYALSNNGFWDCGDDMVLGRVPRSKIASLNGADWEFFTGGDGMRPSVWSRKLDDAKPVVQQPRRFGMTGAVYLPARRRYLMIGWYYPAGGGKMKDAATHTVWDFYEAPRPWGPWAKIGSHDSSPQGYYSPEICPKFQTENNVFVFTAGNWNNPDVYRLTVVPLELSA